MKITAKEAVERALRSAKNCPTKYKLGRGGFNPEHQCPGDNRECDCSAFVAHCLGVSREQPHSIVWVETTIVFNDAKIHHKLFEQVSEAKPGDVIVYGDTDGHQGHIGIVTAVKDGKASRVAHCCARSGLHSAIIDEPASVFWDEAIAHRGAIYARYLGFESEDKMEEVKITIDGIASPYKGRFDEQAGTNLIPLASVKPLLKPGVQLDFDKAKKTLAIKTK